MESGFLKSEGRIKDSNRVFPIVKGCWSMWMKNLTGYQERKRTTNSFDSDIWV